MRYPYACLLILVPSLCLASPGLQPAGQKWNTQVGGGGGGAPTYEEFLGSAQEGSPEGSVDLTPVTVASGNAVIVFLTWEGADASFTVSDSVTNSYTGLTKRSGNGSLYSQIFYAADMTALSAGTITATISSGSPEYLTISAIEVGAESTFGFTATEENYGTGSSSIDVITSAFSTSTADSILVYVAKDDTGTSYTAQDSYTEVYDDVYSTEIAYKIVSSTGSYTGHTQADVENGTPSNWLINAAAFHN